MSKITIFLNRYRKYCFGFLTVVLVILLTAVCSADAKEEKLDQLTIKSDALLSYPNSGYEIKADVTGKVEFTPVSDDPQLLIPLSGDVLNRITLHFSEALSEDLNVQLYFSPNGEVLTEQNSVSAVAEKGESSVSLYLMQRNYSQIRLDIDGSFSIEQISFEKAVSNGYSIEWVPLALLALLVMILAVFNNRIGYFSAIIDSLVGAIEEYRTIYLQKRKKGAALYLAMWITSALYAISLLLFLLFSYISESSIVYMFVLTVIVIFFQLLYRTVIGKGRNPAKMFLIVCLTIGFLFAYILPITTGISWDDQIHYYRSELLSRFVFGHERTLADYGQEVIVYNTKEYFLSVRNINISLLNMGDILYPEKGYAVNFYTYIAYFHSALIIALSDWLSIDFVLQMILMKMINVLIYAFVIYSGLKKIKSGAYLLSSVCLLPTCLFLAASISYDYWVTAFVVYAFAVFLSEMQRPDQILSRRSMVLMLGAMIIGCAPKAIYFLLIIPFLFMSKSKFENKSHRKRYSLACLLVMALILASFILPFFINMDGMTDIRGGADVNSMEQVKFILTNPLKYAGILLRFIGEYMSLNQATANAAYYAYLGNPPMIYATISLCVIAFCTFTDKKKYDEFEYVRTFKWGTLLTSFLQIALFATALYVSFTPVGYGTVNGCSWRYIIPVLFPMLYSLGSCHVVNRISERNVGAIVFGMTSLVAVASVFKVYVSMF